MRQLAVVALLMSAAPAHAGRPLAEELTGHRGGPLDGTLWNNGRGERDFGWQFLYFTVDRVEAIKFKDRWVVKMTGTWRMEGDTLTLTFTRDQVAPEEPEAIAKARRKVSCMATPRVRVFRAELSGDPGDRTLTLTQAGNTFRFSQERGAPVWGACLGDSSFPVVEDASCRQAPKATADRTNADAQPQGAPEPRPPPDAGQK